MVFSGIFSLFTSEEELLLDAISYVYPTGYTSDLTTFLTVEFAFIAGTESPLNRKCYLSKLVLLILCILEFPA